MRPRAWLREPKVQRHSGRHLIRGISAVEPTAEERECADLDGDAIFPLYDQAALDAAVAAEHERCARLAQEARRQFNHWASQRAHAEGSVLRLKVLDALAEIAGPNVAIKPRR